MRKSHGAFVWYELMTTEPPAAEAFYKSVVGWRAKDAGMPNMSYTLFSVGEVPVAGMMAAPGGACAAGALPGWMGHVGVDDVDACAKQAAREGGSIYRGPEDIPGIGRFALIKDPEGVILSLFRGTGEAPPAPAAGTPGFAGWHELAALDQVVAFDFYSKLFGWTKAEPFDMGPMGIYQIFAHNGVPIGGMMTKAEAVPAPGWLYYFNVEGIDAAVTRVKAGRGQVINGPHQVPSGSWIAQCRDPQGAMVAFVASAV